MPFKKAQTQWLLVNKIKKRKYNKKKSQVTVKTWLLQKQQRNLYKKRYVFSSHKQKYLWNEHPRSYYNKFFVKNRFKTQKNAISSQKLGLYWTLFLAKYKLIDNNATLLIAASRLLRKQTKNLRHWSFFWKKHYVHGKYVLERFRYLLLVLSKKLSRFSQLWQKFFWKSRKKSVFFLIKLLQVRCDDLELELFLAKLFALKKKNNHALLKLKKTNFWKKPEKYFHTKQQKRYRVKTVKRRLRKWLRLNHKYLGASKNKAKNYFKKSGAQHQKQKNLLNKTLTEIVRKKHQRFKRKTRFITYYNFVDGVYNSYWFGKFINMFIKEGKKRKAQALIYTAFDSLKYTYNISAFKMLMNTLNKLRSVFKLRKYKVRKGREIK